MMNPTDDQMCLCGHTRRRHPNGPSDCLDCLAGVACHESEGHVYAYDGWTKCSQFNFTCVTCGDFQCDCGLPAKPFLTRAVQALFGWLS